MENEIIKLSKEQKGTYAWEITLPRLDIARLKEIDEEMKLNFGKKKKEE